MIRSTLHNHTTFCDGRSSPEEMVLAAVAAGLMDLGFSAHSPAPFDAGSLRSEAEMIEKSLLFADNSFY